MEAAGSVRDGESLPGNSNMDSVVTHDSVVLHVDLDCFYAAVEHVRLGIPREKPLAVQQWRGLIAINYAARAAGITRHERADQALKKCPELQLVHVETIGETGGNEDNHDRGQAKVSLERYRQASAKVFSVFRRFSNVYEKASIDEAYLDVTAKVEEMTSQSRDWDSELQRLLGDNEQGVPTMVVLDGPLMPFNSYDRRMLAGALVADQIRSSVRNELGYTCSVGIATNKLLAKIASAKNKPDRQTLIPPRAIPGLMHSMPLKKMRLLGGKLGEDLIQKWGLSTAGDAQALSLTTLVSSFGERQGTYVWNAVRGIQVEKVQAKQVPKSMLAAKSFSPIKELADVRRWLAILSDELSVRMLRDFQQNNRHPRLLQLYYRSGEFKYAKDQSKSWPMPHPAINLLSSSSPSLSSPSSTAGKKASEVTATDAHDKDIAAKERDDEAQRRGSSDGPSEDPKLILAPVLAEERQDPLGDMDLDEGDEPSSEFLGLMVTKRSKAIARVLEDASFTMFKRLDGTFPCTRLALAASGFQELGSPGTKSIQHFFSSAGTGAAIGISPTKAHRPPSERDGTKGDQPEAKQKGILRFVKHHESGTNLTPTLENHQDLAVPSKNASGRPSSMESPVKRSLEHSSTSVAAPKEEEEQDREQDQDQEPQWNVNDKRFRDTAETSGEYPNPPPSHLEEVRHSDQSGSGEQSGGNFDLRGVNKKQQIRIYDNIRHARENIKNRHPGLRISAKKRRPADGQQSIGKFFSTQSKPG